MTEDELSAAVQMVLTPDERRMAMTLARFARAEIGTEGRPWRMLAAMLAMSLHHDPQRMAARTADTGVVLRTLGITFPPEKAH